MNWSGRPFALNNQQEEWVKEKLAKMSINEKAGQLFCVLGNLYPETELVEFVKEYNIGGVLLRPDSRETVVKTYELLDRHAKIPLFKAANLEEGGNGAFTEGTRFGTQMQVGAAHDAGFAQKLGRVCAKEGKSIGINWTFSPVTDLNINFQNPITNTRTYGSDVERVSQMSLAYTVAVQECGMAACAKHFPGDGVDYRDHHLHPTINSLTAQEWMDSYGVIYKRLIDNGLLSVMAGHILQPAWSKKINPNLKDEDILPASLSRELLEGLLRKELGFQGLITTDATIMGGYCQAMERSRAIPATIDAGCDMIVFNTSFIEDYNYMLNGLKNGILSEQRLDEAVTRVLACKASLHLYEKQPLGNYPKKQHKHWQMECADKAITLVKNKENIIPLDKNRYKSVQFIVMGNTQCADGHVGEIAAQYMKTKGFQTEIFDIDQCEMEGPGALPKDRVTIYLANCEAKSDLTTVRLFWSEKLALDLPRYIKEEPQIFISLANPYHLQDVPRIRTYINAYTASKETILAALEKIMGTSEFTGVSPVDPFCGLFDTRL